MLRSVSVLTYHNRFNLYFTVTSYTLKATPLPPQKNLASFWCSTKGICLQNLSVYKWLQSPKNKHK